MTLNELHNLNEDDIIEVNGIKLGVQVSMLTIRKYERDRQTQLLRSYYEFLEQCKNNGFKTQYIKLPVKVALCIFDNSEELGSKCFRAVK